MALTWSILEKEPEPVVVAAPASDNEVRNEGTGILKAFKREQGFGFIKADDGSKDIFAHARQFDGNVDDLEEGDKVRYEAAFDETRGKRKASRWSRLAAIKIGWDGKQERSSRAGDRSHGGPS